MLKQIRLPLLKKSPQKSKREGHVVVKASVMSAGLCLFCFVCLFMSVFDFFPFFFKIIIIMAQAESIAHNAWRRVCKDDAY